MSDGLTVVGLKSDEKTITVVTIQGDRVLTRENVWEELQKILTDPQIPHDVVTSQGGVTPDILVEQGCDVAEAYVEQEFGTFASALVGEGKRRLLGFMRGTKDE